MKQLLIRVVDIQESGLSIELKEPAQRFSPIPDLEQTGDCRFTAPVAFSGRAARAGQMVRITGTIRTTVERTCGRCLSEFQIPVEESIDMAFAPRDLDKEEDADTTEKELDAEDIGITYFDGEQIDAKDVLEQQIIMSLSHRPICHDACKGLCHSCGANLNDGKCRCRKETINNRFEILKNLKLDE